MKGPGLGRLTTHVLDTARGRPAAGMRVVLRRGEEVLGRTETNADGRAPAPLLEGAAFRAGCYTLVFAVGDYFRTAGVALADPPFFDEVEIAFAIGAESAHIHVPLLVSPYGYTTYRGS